MTYEKFVFQQFCQFLGTLGVKVNAVILIVSLVGHFQMSVEDSVSAFLGYLKNGSSNFSA